MIVLLFSCWLFPHAQRVYAEKNSQEENKPLILVLDFSNNNVKKTKAKIIRNIVENTFYQTHKFEILEYNQRIPLLKLKKEQSTACNTPECALVMGEEYNADYVLLGSIDKLTTTIINLKVVCVMERKIIIRDTLELEDNTSIRETTQRLSLRVAHNLGNYGKTELFDNPLRLSINPLYTYPSANFKDVADIDPGYGVEGNLSIVDVLLPHITCGFAAQYIHLKGKKHTTHHAYLLPVSFTLGYLYPLKNFHIEPVIGAGISFNTLYYYEAQTSSSYRKRSGRNPFMSAGITMIYNLNDSYFIRLGAAYQNIFEEGGNLGFYSFSLGGGISL